MSNWTPKQALSGLMSKFRRSDSEGSSSSSSDAEVEGVDTSARADEVQTREADDTPIAPLALQSEGTPEAWLVQFLLELDMGDASRRGTLEGASRDTELMDKLRQVREASAQGSPLHLLDEAAANRLRAADWAAWWRGQEALARYAYSTLALALLGSREHVEDLRVLYVQTANSRIQKHSHYVLCHMLGKQWPGYQVSEADFARLQSGT